ncbi:MAG: hypothetical protein LM569_02530 [Desulfurococcaceae archaeon]|nr:hypothetical protein [Desulfurococcaceae archaeon]
MASSELTSPRDSVYTATLKSLPLDKLEEILLIIEKSIREYLDEKLAKYSDYSLVASISRSPTGVDLVVDLVIDRCFTFRDSCEKLASDALNYAKRRVEEYLEDISRGTVEIDKSF